MKRLFFAALTLSATVVTAGTALAQVYPPYAYAPSYPSPYNAYYPQYAPPPPPATYYAPVPYDGTHSAGTAGRAYGYGQKSN